MDIRLTGTKEEIKEYVDDLKNFYDVVSVSIFYPNNRKTSESKEGRVYLKIKI